MTTKEKLMILIKGSADEKASAPKVKKQREKKITRLHLILAGFFLVAAIVTVIVVKVKIDTKNNIYHEYEKELVYSANNYYRINKYEIKDGTTEKIDINKLYEEGFVNIDSKYNKLRSTCIGYVESVSSKDYNDSEYKISRKAYIKCGSKYKTVNYIGY